MSELGRIISMDDGRLMHAEKGNLVTLLGE